MKRATVVVIGPMAVALLWMRMGQRMRVGGGRDEERIIASTATVTSVGR